MMLINLFLTEHTETIVDKLKNATGGVEKKLPKYCMKIYANNRWIREKVAELNSKSVKSNDLAVF